MSASFVNTLNEMMTDGLNQDLIHHHTEDEKLDGRTIQINGKQLLNFGSCSYLGLEQHPALEKGLIQAVGKYGTQFSSSRTYASLGLYKALENKLRQIFAKPLVITASTTLGHLATIPVIIEDNDAIIMDMQVHNSVQMAVQLLKAEGVSISIIRHNDMEMLEEKIQKLRNKHRKIWFMADGVYSMYGDYAPLPKLVELMDRYESLHLYIDDAHGMSWAGKNGCGYVRSQIEHHPKMVLAGSLNKSFATAGGMIVFPNQEMAQKVRNCGGTMIFSGPIQPPMLGAALASVELHMSEEIVEAQQSLAEKIAYTNRRISELGLPQFEETDSPLFFIPVGLPKTTYAMIKALHQDKIYVNTASFPATPVKRGGVRFMINGNMTLADIDCLLESLSRHYVRVLGEHNSSPKKVARTFRIPEFYPIQHTNSLQELKSLPASLEIILDKSIQRVDVNEWDSIMAERGNFNHSNLQLLEQVFTQENKPEQHWDFTYVRIKDRAGRIVLSTFYTVAMVKDDMFAPAFVSRQIEAEREKNPYYLNSKMVLIGSLITKGESIYLDRNHPEWKTAFKMLISQMQQTVEETGASQLMIREFVKESDPELKAFLTDQGLIQMELLSLCKMHDLNWKDEAEYLQRLGGKYRYNVRKEILPFTDQFDIVKTKPQTQEEIQECYELYCQVHANAFELNVHRLPYAFFEKMCGHDNYDIIRLYLKEEAEDADRKPVAVMFSFVDAGKYHAMIVGLNYEYVRSHNTYKQILFQTVWRAWELNCTEIDLAFTAELEKKKVGARPVAMVAYVQVMDHFNHAVIASCAQRPLKLKTA